MKAEEFFTDGLLLVIKHYGGNTVDYAIVVDSNEHYHLWKFNPRIQKYERQFQREDLSEIFTEIENDILDNPKIED